MGALSLQQSDLEPSALLEYLRDTSRFCYFGPDTRRCVEDLPDDVFGEQDKAPERAKLLALWKRVLTDALWGLKERDRREVDPQDKRTDYRTFFDEGSLGVLELQEVVEAFMQFETHMYAASPDRYRDHVRHSFLVWITGHRLLCEGLGGKASLDAPSGLKMDDYEWQCMWALAALCHDIGYPLAQVDKVGDHAKSILTKQGFRALGNMQFAFSAEVQPFCEVVMKLMASKVVRVAPHSPRFVTHLQNKYYLKFLKSFDQLKHGAISAILMAKSLVYFLESDLCLDARSPLSKEDARQFLIRRELLRAIASHTSPDIYHLEFDSLGFLLFLADEIQESGRPTLDESLGGDGGRETWTCRAVKFGKRSVRIEMETSASWKDKKGQGRVRERLNRVRRKLRLAVDTPKLKKLELTFLIKAKEGKQMALVLGRDNDKFGIRIISDECAPAE